MPCSKCAASLRNDWLSTVRTVWILAKGTRIAGLSESPVRGRDDCDRLSLLHWFQHDETIELYEIHQLIKLS